MKTLPIEAENAVVSICEEYLNARRKYPARFNSAHEGYAVVLEEIEELWAEVKKQHTKHDVIAQRHEATQAAAMLLRFIVELT